MSEGRILVALQHEVTTAEARLEEEQAAHKSTQRAAAAREQVHGLPFSYFVVLAHAGQPCFQSNVVKQCGKSSLRQAPHNICNGHAPTGSMTAM